MQSNSDILIGIDWGDREHALQLRHIDGTSSRQKLEQCPEAIHQWVADLRAEFPDANLVIAIEQSKGALIAALVKYDHITIYPINPTKAASYRESQSHSGAKNDVSDARLLLQYLEHYREHLRCLKLETTETRELIQCVEQRRLAVEQRVALSNELKACLKQYFPLVLQLVESKLYAKFIVDLLIRWPTFRELQVVKLNTLRRFFYSHNLRGDIVEKRLERIQEAVSLTDDPAIIRCGALRATHCAKLLKVLNETIAQYDKLIAERLESHPDLPIFDSLPGAALHMKSRMIAAMGTDRERFADAAELQKYSGIAPVTKQSGRSKYVHHRWSAPKFVKQTFHEYAGLSIRKSTWARAYYTMMLERGLKPQAAKRSLAFKWQRVIYRCWKERKPYDEELYLHALAKRKSPLLDYIESPQKLQSST